MNDAHFGFERPVHRAAWLAALLTPLARFAFSGPTPLFLVDANVRGAGKGLLLDCISAVTTGQRFTVATCTDNEEELRKRITSLCLAGDRLVLFDNLEGKFGNATLDAALTATAWKDRILGGNRMAEAPLYMTWYATGNNVVIAADTARRVCHVRLESPEERLEFRHPNLLAWVKADRGRLLSAALTVLRAYCAAGHPDQDLPAWGSFEAWSALVHSAVVWVDLPDPGATRLLLQEPSDTVAESMALLLACWQTMDPDRRGLTAAAVIDRLYKHPPEPPPEFHAEFKAGLESLLAKPEARLLGNKLRSYRRRVFRGLFIDQAGAQQRAARWAVYPVDGLPDAADRDGAFLRGDETTADANLGVVSGQGRVVRRPRHRLLLHPFVGDRVVLVVGAPGLAAAPAADHVQLAARGDAVEFFVRLRERRPLLPRGRRHLSQPGPGQDQSDGDCGKDRAAA
jgi:hypothetical protein